MIHIKVLLSIYPFGAIDRRPLDLLKSNGIAYIQNPYQRKMTEAELAEVIVSFDAVIAGTEPFSTNVLKKADNLKLIARVGVGHDNIDGAEAQERGIQITMTPDAAADSVAELTMGLIVALTRGIHTSHQSIQKGQWKRTLGIELRGKVLGIIGFGHIGQRVAKMAQVFGMSVKACDPYVQSEEMKKLAVQPCHLDGLLSTSHIISLHAPLVAETQYLMNTNRIKLMQPESYLINTARGGLMDEQALYQALKSGHIAGAALDVFSQEPYQGPLCTLDNVLLTAHIGANAREARVRMELEAAQSVCDFFH